MHVKFNSTLFAGLFVFLLAGSPAVSFGADVDAGKALYDKNCAGCHGPDGKGNPAVAKTLGEKGLNIAGKETKEKSDAALLKVIAEGAGKMPPSKKLTADEQKSVLQYSRSLAK
jgi:mono/diheme cytochrome c family protein